MLRSSSALSGSPSPLSASDMAVRSSSILNEHPVLLISPSHLLRYVIASPNLPFAVMHMPRAAAVSVSPTYDSSALSRAIAFFPSASSISEIRAPLDGQSESTDSASSIALGRSPILRLMRAAISLISRSSHSSDRLWTISRDSLSGKSMNMYLLDWTSFVASCLRFERNRWYSLSRGSHPFSKHQSAALLCQSLIVSASALRRNQSLVSGLMFRRPPPSKGSSLGAVPSKSQRRTGHLRTRAPPTISLSSFGNDHSFAEQQ